MSKITHDDIFNYSKKELKEIFDIVKEMSLLEDRLLKYNITIPKLLNSFKDCILKK